MCDTVWVPGNGRSYFAKNSDRPVGEIQVVETFPAREPGGVLRTQYLALPDPGAAALLGSRPTWLWGLEHGVNTHRVAIGNERVWTVDDPTGVAPALIGMDLVRLALERAATASAAVDVMGHLLETHGQGGPAESPNGEPYWSSFLVADPSEAWVFETSGSHWAAKPVEDGVAISNRLSLGADWQRGSELATGMRFDNRHDPMWAPIADVRLACTRPEVADPQRVSGPEDLAALMRHHGDQPWGRPDDHTGPVSAVPAPEIGADGTGVTVCMHVRGLQVTSASMICELPGAPEEPTRAWVALGSPCASVYVPVFPDSAGGVPEALGRPDTWARFDALRQRAEADPDGLGEIRAVLAPVEAQLWAEADSSAHQVDAHPELVAALWSEVETALSQLLV